MSVSIGNTVTMGDNMERIDILGASLFRCTVCGYSDYQMTKVRGHIGGRHFAQHDKNTLAVTGVLGRTPHDPIAAAQKQVTRDLGSKVNRLAKQNQALKSEVRQLRKERTQLMRALRKGKHAA